MTPQQRPRVLGRRSVSLSPRLTSSLSCLEHLMLKAVKLLERGECGVGSIYERLGVILSSN